MDALLYVLIGLCAASAILSAVLLANQKKSARQYEKIIKQDLEEQQRALRLELSETVQGSVRALGSLIAENQKEGNRAQAERLQHMQQALTDMSTQVENRLKTSAMENEQKLEFIRSTVEKNLSGIQTDNNKKLDEMRQIVDEKLQKTLDARMTQSFQLVNERLEQVYKGLGEMQSLAVGVGDLKKVLSNVKTRGYTGRNPAGCHPFGDPGAGAVRYQRHYLCPWAGAGGIRHQNPRGRRGAYLSARRLQVPYGRLR